MLRSQEKSKHKTRVGAAIAILSCTLAAQYALAQDRAASRAYPTKPIRIAIGTPAGGGSEFIARVAGQLLTQAWGLPVVVDPHPGASGNIAAELVARSPADGYTLYVCYGTHTVNPSLYARVPYDPIKDFAPVTLLSVQVNALTVHPSVPAKSVSELVALAHRSPGKLSYASSGNGSPNHLGMEQFKMMAKLDIVHVPYKEQRRRASMCLAGKSICCSMCCASLYRIANRENCVCLRSAVLGARRLHPISRRWQKRAGGASKS